MGESVKRLGKWESQAECNLLGFSRGGTPRKPKWAADTTTQLAQKLGKHQKPKPNTCPFPPPTKAIESLWRELKGIWKT